MGFLSRTQTHNKAVPTNYKGTIIAVYFQVHIINLYYVTENCVFNRIFFKF